MAERDAEAAINLMKMAIALLDKAGAGHTSAACHLQAAIDCGLTLENHDEEKMGNRY